MTNLEAAEVLQKMHDCGTKGCPDDAYICEVCPYYVEPKTDEAVFSMAIEALRTLDKQTNKQNEQTNKQNEFADCKSDAISRQAAIDAIFGEPLYESGMMKRDADTVVPAICEKIKSLPSVQPEIAKRIVGKSRDGMTLWYQYDMCNEPVDAQDNFCRGCGRRLTDG